MTTTTSTFAHSSSSSSKMWYGHGRTCPIGCYGPANFFCGSFSPFCYLHSRIALQTYHADVGGGGAGIGGAIGDGGGGGWAVLVMRCLFNHHLCGDTGRGGGGGGGNTYSGSTGGQHREKGDKNTAQIEEREQRERRQHRERGDRDTAQREETACTKRGDSLHRERRQHRERTQHREKTQQDREADSRQNCYMCCPLCAVSSPLLSPPSAPSPLSVPPPLSPSPLSVSVLPSLPPLPSRLSALLGVVFCGSILLASRERKMAHELMKVVFYTCARPLLTARANQHHGRARSRQMHAN